MCCPSCNSVNARDAVRCAACDAALPRRPARRRSSEDAETTAANEESNRAALRAYRLSLIGLIPLAGLVLGPVALVLGVLAARKGRADPTFTARGPALAAVFFGVLDSLTNWVGVTLMILGLMAAFSP